MSDASTILTIVGVFFLAGAIKGVIGLGLPIVSLALLTLTRDLTSAMALLLLPSFITNVWQAMVGGNGRAMVLRLWPFLLLATVTVWIGAAALTRIDLSVLTALLGALLVTYSIVNLSGLRLTVPARHEVWAGPLLGSANGILTGMTGTFMVPGGRPGGNLRCPLAPSGFWHGSPQPRQVNGAQIDNTRQ